MPFARAFGSSSARAARNERRNSSVFSALRTNSLWVTPSAFAALVNCFRIAGGRLMVTVSLIAVRQYHTVAQPTAQARYQRRAFIKHGHENNRIVVNYGNGPVRKAERTQSWRE